MAKGRDKSKGSTVKSQKAETRKAKRVNKKSAFQEYGTGGLDSQLEQLGLCTKDMVGDGNCLFRALSDQYAGSDKMHKKIRQDICQSMRLEKEKYECFIEDDRSFEDHVDCMEEDGTFGGNIEIVVFARLYLVNIKIYQPGLIYCVYASEEEDAAEKERPTLHLAYHSWEHYSSIRRIEGPHTGPPEIKVEDSFEAKEENEEDTTEDTMTSQEKTVQNSCPDVSVRRIRTLLRKYKGDPDKVIDFLYEAMYQEEEKKEETEAQMDEPKNKEENKDISKESAGPTLSQPLETDTLNDTPTQDQKTHDPVILDSKPAPPTTETVAEEEPALMKSQTKVKRKSAHQRKQEAKLLQKAQRLEKKRGSAKASGSTETETSQDPDGLSKPMKQLCI